MFRLTLSFSGETVQKFNFDKNEVTIGRDVDCDVMIDNIGVSRRHATIEHANGEYILTDLKSNNGTFVRGERVYHHQLNEADEFFIGKYGLHFENLDMDQEPKGPIANLSSKLAGMQDLTFRLDKNEIAKLMGASASMNIPKLAQISPQSERRTLRLESGYYLIGTDSRAQIRIGGWFTPRIVGLIAKDDNRFHVISLSRKRPAKVNGRKVFDHAFNDGDVVKFGRRKFRFSLR